MIRVFVAVLCATVGVGATEPVQIAVLTHDGGAHLGIYFRALAQIPEVGSVVLSDADGTKEAEARAALGEKLTAVYPNPEALFAAEHPVMALVSMEAALTPPVIDAALDAGCHVVAEKPACVRAEDFAPLAAKASAHGLHLMLALANRMNPEVREARRLLRDGTIGDVYGVEMHLIQDQTRLSSPQYQASWYADRTRSGGGHLAWLGIHWLDLASFVTGSAIEAVTGFSGNVGGQPIGIEDSVAMAIRFDNGTFGTLTSGYYLKSGSVSNMTIWGSKGWLQFDSAEPRTLQVVVTADAGPDTTEFVRPDGFDPYRTFLAEAVRASMGEGPPPITAEESLRALTAVFSLYKAADSGRVQAAK